MDTTENVIIQFHPHWFSFLGFYFSGIFFIIAGFFVFHFTASVTIGLLPILLGIIVMMIGEISRRAETFYVLETGIERGYDLFSTSRKFLEYAKIQDIEVDQSFFQNMFNVGSVKFDTAGTGKVELDFYCVKDPYAIEKVVRGKMALS